MNLSTQPLNTVSTPAERLAEAARDTAVPRLRQAAGSAMEALAPLVAFAVPLARRVNWRMVALGLVAGVAGYLIRARIGSAANRRAPANAAKPPELNRWENEGGMIATSVPAAAETPPQG